MSEIKDISKLVKEARIKKGYSARELAKLCDISHTEINNIERGYRVRPAVLTLKAFEKYLDLDYKVTARLVGYSEETIEYGDENIIVSYERYDKKVSEFEQIKKRLIYQIHKRRHLGIDIKEYYDLIYNYLKTIDEVPDDIMRKANSINLFLSDLTEEFDESIINISEK